mmetsp:Transcript_19154/g.22833  ORF Transcript_19154/g.22833 Transcript_19154/m.22833 type:complete len:288 (-) Transcript_19154:96-959(-)
MDFWKDYLIGVISGGISKTFTTPIDAIMRVPRIAKTAQPRKGQQAIVNVLQIKANEVSSLWRGNLINMLRYCPIQGYYFALKAAFKKNDILYPHNPNPTIFYQFMVNTTSGSLAGFTSLAIMYPIINGPYFASGHYYYLKTDQPPPGLYNSISSRYKGFTLTSIDVIIYRGLYFGINDTLAILNPYQNISTCNSFISLMSKYMQAHISVHLANTCSYPIHTIRKRLVMTSEKEMYKNGFDCLIKIITKEGFFSLFHGIRINQFRQNIGPSIGLVSFGELQRLVAVEE